MNFTSLNEAWNIESFSSTETEKNDTEIQNEKIEVKKEKSLNLEKENKKEKEEENNIVKIKSEISNLKEKIKDLEIENNKLKNNKSTNKKQFDINSLMSDVQNFIDKNRDTIVIVLIMLALYLFFKIMNKEKVNNLIQSKYYSRPYY